MIFEFSRNFRERREKLAQLMLYFINVTKPLRRYDKEEAMEGTKKKIPAILLACLMAAALVLVMNVLDTQPAYASNYSSDAKLVIGGRVIDPNSSVVDAGWVYSDGTLTLNSANIYHIGPDAAAPVHVEGMDLKIFINTQSNIDGSFDADYGIYMAGGTLTIEGTGKLLVRGTYAGIALDGGELVIRGDAEVVASSTEGGGISMYREAAEGTGNFTIEGNSIVVADGEDDAGIYMDTGDLIVNGGKKLTASGCYYGIITNKVDIKGNNVTATALGELDFEEPDFSIFSRGDIKMQNTEVNAPHGIFSGGNVTVDGSELIAGSKQSVVALITGYQEVDEPVLDEGGIEPAYGKGGDITIKNSEVTSEGFSGMRASGSIKIEDTEGTTVVKSSAINYVTPVLDADDGEPVETNLVPAFTAAKNMSIGDNLKIVEPEGGILGRYQMIDSWTTFATVLESNGEEVATDALIKATGKPSPKPGKPSGVLLTKVTAKGNTGLTISWTKMKNVDGYDVFFSRCNSGGKHVSKKPTVRTFKADKKPVWIKTGLKEQQCYKVFVRAWVKKDGEKVYVKSSPAAHVLTSDGNKNRTNAKSLTVKKPKVTLSPGKAFRIKATTVKIDPTKKIISNKHAPKLRYISSNPKIAGVNSHGRVKARTKGSCNIYVFAANGVYTKVSVEVK